MLGNDNTQGLLHTTLQINQMRLNVNKVIMPVWLGKKEEELRPGITMVTRIYAIPTCRIPIKAILCVAPDRISRVQILLVLISPLILLEERQ